MRLTSIITLAAIPAAGSTHACETPDTIVSDVYPTSTNLPENLLRFYIYFSSPMGQDDILSSITLLDGDGAELDGVFLSNRFNLWSPDRKRLTLLLDPGRVKTGLVANQAMGRALVAGQTYQLRIADTALDAKNCQLSASHFVSFETKVADVSSPEPENWGLTIPQSGTRAPLTVTLDGAIDHLSLAYRLRILKPDGTNVHGRIALDSFETVWRFTPREPWDQKIYQLSVDPLLEDLAGNRIDAVFDLDLGSSASSMTPSTHRLVPFIPSPS